MPIKVPSSQLDIEGWPVRFGIDREIPDAFDLAGAVDGGEHRVMTPPEVKDGSRVLRAWALRRSGLSLRRIARLMGMNPMTLSRMMNRKAGGLR